MRPTSFHSSRVPRISVPEWPTEVNAALVLDSQAHQTHFGGYTARYYREASTGLPALIVYKYDQPASS